MASKAYLAKCLTLLSAAFPANKIDPAQQQPMIEIYGIVLEDIPDDVLGQVVSKLCAECRFFPAASEIRSAALEIMRGGPAGRTSALEEWGKVRALVSLYGRDGWSQAKESLTNTGQRAMEALGWWDYCMSDIEDAASWRARFVEAFNAIDHRETAVALQPPSVTRYIESRQAQALEIGAALAKRLSAPGRRQ